MPQLDKVTFLSQFFWLSTFFISFYFVLLKHFLPRMSRILKWRTKKMSGSQEEGAFVDAEQERVRGDIGGLIAKTCTTSRTFINKNMNRTEEWVEAVRYDTNKVHYGTLNTSFISFVGQYGLVTDFANTELSTIFSSHLVTRSSFVKLD